MMDKHVGPILPGSPEHEAKLMEAELRTFTQGWNEAVASCCTWLRMRGTIDPADPNLTRLRYLDADALHIARGPLDEEAGDSVGNAQESQEKT